MSDMDPNGPVDRVPQDIEAMQAGYQQRHDARATAEAAMLGQGIVNTALGAVASITNPEIGDGLMKAGQAFIDGVKPIQQGEVVDDVTTHAAIEHLRTHGYDQPPSMSPRTEPLPPDPVPDYDPGVEPDFPPEPIPID